MGNLGQTFDPTTVPEDENRPDFENLPTAWYMAQVIESEMKISPEGASFASCDLARVNLTWEVMTGPHERRKFWQGENIINRRSDKGAENERISQRRFADVCEATGAGRIDDTSELHFKPCMVYVGLGKPNKDYPDPRNEPKRWKAVGSVGSQPAAQPAPQPRQSQPSRAQPAQAAQPQQQRAAAGSRPWGNR